MSRRRIPKKRIVKTDPLYNSHLVTMIINRLLKKGKKTLAQKIFYDTMEKIKVTLPEQEALDVLNKENVCDGLSNTVDDCLTLYTKLSHNNDVSNKHTFSYLKQTSEVLKDDKR